MRAWLGTVLLTLGIIGAPAVQADSQSKLVTVVTSAHPQTQLMAMVLSMQAARQGAQVHMLLCGDAADIALREAPEDATVGQPPRDMSPQGLMTALMNEMGATVEVCAIYLPGRGEGQEALLDGIGVAKPPEMAVRLMATDARILSF